MCCHSSHVPKFQIRVRRTRCDVFEPATQVRLLSIHPQYTRSAFASPRRRSGSRACLPFGSQNGGGRGTPGPPPLASNLDGGERTSRERRVSPHLPRLSSLAPEEGRTKRRLPQGEPRMM